MAELHGGLSYSSAVPHSFAVKNASESLIPEAFEIKRQGIVSLILDKFQEAPLPYTIATMLVTVLTWLYMQSIPKMDPREPPLLMPRIPFIGHILSVAIDQKKYFKSLHERTGASIATLAVLGNKMYAIWDPELMQSALRQKTLAFEPIAVDFAELMLGMSEDTYKLIRNEQLVTDFFDVLRTTFRGENLFKLNSGAVNYISRRLDTFAQQPTTVPNLFDWVRHLMTTATCNSLLGVHSPFIDNPDLVDHLWTWEFVAHRMLLVPFHNLTYPDAVKSREILQTAMGKYYVAKHDTHESVAAVTAQRAQVLRNYGVKDSEIGRFEASLVQLATANTIPTAFWVLSHIVTNEELLIQVRQELESMVTFDNDSAILRTADFETAAPLFVSCYYETVRFVNHALCGRRVTKDTVISNSKGERYLLKKGVDVQMSGGYTHNIGEIWGEDAAQFRPDRFLRKQNVQDQDRKKQKRSAFIPYGGGKHLCPGRHFAFTEIQSCVAMLLLGFDITSTDGSAMKLADMAPTTIMGAAGRPLNRGCGTEVVMRRRPGWENIKFNFEIGTAQPTPF